MKRTEIAALEAEKNRVAAEAQRRAAEEERLAAAEAERKAVEEARLKVEFEKQAKEKAMEILAAERARELEAQAERLAEAQWLEEQRLKAQTEQAPTSTKPEPAPQSEPISRKHVDGHQESATPKAPQNDGPGIGYRINSAALEHATKLLEKLQAIKVNVRPAVRADAKLNRFCFKAKMTVTLKVGQITNSRQQVRRISHELNEVLAEAGRESHLAREWLMDFTAKQLANQAEKEVAVFKPLAFPMARVAQNIVARNPDFCDIFWGRLMKRNPFLVPKYPIKEKGESLDDYCKRLRMKRRDDGWEKETHYEERICGTVALFAGKCRKWLNRLIAGGAHTLFLLFTLAFLQRLPEGTAQSYCTLNDGWTWLARLLNMPPKKITPHLLLTFLEVGPRISGANRSRLIALCFAHQCAGPELMRVYRKQMNKLLRFIADKYTPQMPKDSVAATTRLRLYLEAHRGRSRLAEAEGFHFATDA